MNRILFYLVLSITFLGCKEEDSSPGHVESRGIIHLADPTIFYHQEVYYLYGTSGRDADQGFYVYTSADMKTWEGPNGVNGGYALRKEDVFGDQGFWAPQVFYYNDKFYMAYTANENIALAESDSPLGPFTQVVKEPLAAPVRLIDPYVFIDEDDKKYLYHVRLNNGNKIYVAELTDDLSAIKEETLKECIVAEEQWENTAGVGWTVAEGPSILKHNDLYYLTYSANDFRNPDYAVGYAVSTSPLGPWEKNQGNPILSREDVGQNGTGHGDFIKDGQENLYYVLHTHFSDDVVSPRKTAVVKVGFAESQTPGDPARLILDEESFYYLEVQ